MTISVLPDEVVAVDMDLYSGLQYLDSDQIWAILLGFGPLHMLGFGPLFVCIDLSHIAWLWAIWQNLGQNRPKRRQRPEDGVRGQT